jgi:zinc resistance-associated protein
MKGVAGSNIVRGVGAARPPSKRGAWNGDNDMWKSTLIGATAVALVGGTLVAAQDGPRGPHDMERGGFFAVHRQLTPKDMRAFADARIAALKAGLTLTPEQEKNWPAFEQAVRELAKLRFERMQAAESAAAESDPIARLQRRADAVSRRGALLKQLAAAAAPLYQSLDDAQKRRFQILARFGRGQRMHGGPDGMRGHWRERFEGR